MHEQEKIPAIQIFYPLPSKNAFLQNRSHVSHLPALGEWGWKTLEDFTQKQGLKRQKDVLKQCKLKKIINITGPKTMWEIV